jgi:hypothetical protein
MEGLHAIGGNLLKISTNSLFVVCCVFAIAL